MKKAVYFLCILISFLCLTPFAQAIEPTEPSLRIGYAGNRDGLTQRFHYREDNFTVNPQDYYNLQKCRLDNVWIGVTLPFTVNDDLNFDLSGGIAVPNSVGAIGTPTGRPGWVDVAMENTAFGFLEGSVSYRMFGAARVIGGFRWDQTNTRLTGERSFGPNHLVATCDAKANAYIPFVGLEVKDSWSNADLSCRVVCSPLALGAYHGTDYLDVDPAHGSPYVSARSYDQSFTSGKLFDGLLEFKRTFPGMGLAGLFVGFTYLQMDDSSLGELHWYDSNSAPVDPEQIRMSFQKSYWTIGGSLTLNFSVILVGIAGKWSLYLSMVCIFKSFAGCSPPNRSFKG